MSHKLSFGQYKDKTFEWIFFKAPWYADWLYQNRVHRQEFCMDELECDYFRELYLRASHLGGICPACGERPVTCMGLTTQHSTGALNAVGFYCDECEYQGGSPTGYFHPSFFVEDYGLPRCEQLRISAEIQRDYIGGDGNLTQKKMEEFFYNDANFTRCTTGFFQREEVAA